MKRSLSPLCFLGDGYMLKKPAHCWTGYSFDYL